MVSQTYIYTKYTKLFAVGPLLLSSTGCRNSFVIWAQSVGTSTCCLSLHSEIIWGSKVITIISSNSSAMACMLGPHTYCVSLEHGGMANCLFWGCREAPDRVGHHGQERLAATSLPPHTRRRTYTLHGGGTTWPEWDQNAFLSSFLVFARIEAACSSLAAKAAGEGCWLNRLPCLTSLTTTLKRLLLLLTFLSKMVKIWFIFLSVFVSSTPVHIFNCSLVLPFEIVL